jgi:5-deoxy-glucuronate isomerase
MTIEVPWHLPAGSLASGGNLITLTPKDAQWRYSGLQVFALVAGETRSIELGGIEAAVIPLSAQGLTVDIAAGDAASVSFSLQGRAGVFAGVTDWVYAPTGSIVTITASTAGEVALATAKAEEVFPPAYLAADSYPVTVRGAGSSTRQVNLQGHPDTFAGAHRLVWCEVLAPGGNWSSYPPHRHDGIGDCPWENEEIYYFRIGKEDLQGKVGPHGNPEGFGIHRTYTAPEDPGLPVDATVEVRDGDVFLVPRGYHGPSIAAPGYPMYYLNVLAGPNDRTLSFCDDPDHAWIRESWNGVATDPRVPITPVSR